MKTKYILTRSGDFMIFNEGIGFQHFHARDILDCGRAIAAGFIHLNEDRSLKTWGGSIGLDIASRSEDADIIQKAIDEGKVRIVTDYVHFNVPFATTDQSKGDAFDAETFYTKVFRE